MNMLMRRRMMMQQGSSDIDFQIKNIRPSEQAIDTGFAPFVTAKDMTICMSWDLQRFTEPTDNIKSDIGVISLKSGTSRQFTCAYYHTYFYFDLFGDRRTRPVANCIVGEIRCVMTYDNANKKAKRFITYHGKYDDRTLDFVTGNGTIEIRKNNNTVINELTVYNRLFTEEEALSYINS